MSCQIYYLCGDLVGPVTVNKLVKIMEAESFSYDFYCFYGSMINVRKQ